jgi:hypothetical protein
VWNLELEIDLPLLQDLLFTLTFCLTLLNFADVAVSQLLPQLQEPIIPLGFMISSALLCVLCGKSAFIALEKG